MELDPDLRLNQNPYGSIQCIEVIGHEDTSWFYRRSNCSIDVGRSLTRQRARWRRWWGIWRRFHGGGGYGGYGEGHGYASRGFYGHGHYYGRGYYGFCGFWPGWFGGPYWWPPYYYDGYYDYYGYPPPYYDYDNAPTYYSGGTPPSYSQFDGRDNLMLGHDSGKALRLKTVSQEWLVEYLRAYIINAPPSAGDDFRRGFVTGYGDGAEAVLKKATEEAGRPKPQPDAAPPAAKSDQPAK